MSIFKSKCKNCDGTGIFRVGGYEGICTFCDGKLNRFNSLFWFTVWVFSCIVVSSIIAPIIYYKDKLFNGFSSSFKSAKGEYDTWFNSLDEFPQIFVQCISGFICVSFLVLMIYIAMKDEY